MMRYLSRWALAAALLALWGWNAQAAPTKITWYGHAAFFVTTPGGTVFALDPWLKNPLNPNAQPGKDPFAVGKVDYIVLSHGHFDHASNAVELAQKTGAKVSGPTELTRALVNHGGLAPDQVAFGGINIGGDISTANGEVMLSLVPAVHGSDFSFKTSDGKNESVYAGPPAGIILAIKGGPTIYDTGDTAYFSDMKLIGEMYHPDVILVNIGGHYGMEPHMAAQAVKTVGAKLAIPMHWKTFPVLTQDEGPFVREVENMGIKVLVMKPLQTIAFEGKTLQ